MKTFKKLLLGAAILFNSCAIMASVDQVSDRGRMHLAVMPKDFNKGHGCWTGTNDRPYCDKTIYGAMGQNKNNDEGNKTSNPKEEYPSDDFEKNEESLVPVGNEESTNPNDINLLEESTNPRDTNPLDE